MNFRATYRRPAVWLLWVAALLVGVGGAAIADVLSGSGPTESAGQVTEAANTATDRGQVPTVPPIATDSATGAGADEAGVTGSAEDGAVGSGSSSRSSTSGLAGSPATGRSELADLITELPPAATGLPVLEPEGPKPVGLAIPALDVDQAPVVAVGVEPDGQMEVPPADEVGWYRYGPKPGDDGASVLAAHIAYEGEDGVFVNLDDVEVGDEIELYFSDGSTKRFEAVEVTQYDKYELPQDRVWGREGESSLVLITCGGDFNPNLRSYEDNIVVYARPLG